MQVKTTIVNEVESIMYDEKSAAHYLGIAKSTLTCGRCTGQRKGRMPLPPFYKIGRRVLYKKTDLDTWIEQFRVEPTAP